ncbi:hypothetical protein, partial [Muribaculum intestinale]
EYMPVTHGVTGSSPVRTAEERGELFAIQSFGIDYKEFFFIYILPPHRFFYPYYTPVGVNNHLGCITN